MYLTVCRRERLVIKAEVFMVDGRIKYYSLGKATRKRKDRGFLGDRPSSQYMRIHQENSTRIIDLRSIRLPVPVGRRIQGHWWLGHLQWLG